MTKLTKRILNLNKIVKRDRFSKDQPISGLLITEKSGVLIGMATDGHIGARISEESKSIAGEVLETIILKADDAQKLAVSIRKDTFINIDTLATNKNGQVHCSTYDMKNHSSTITIVEKIKGEFPDLERAIPHENPTATVRIDSRLLIKLLEVISISESDHVDLHFFGDNKPIKMESEHKESGAYAVGVIMPIRTKY